MRRFLKRALASVIVLCFSLMFNPIHLYAADSGKGKPTSKAPDWLGTKSQNPGGKDAKPGQKLPKLKGGAQKQNPGSK